MNVGPFQILIIALVLLVLFGRGRISEMMGDFGKGIKSFRKSMADDDGVAPMPHVEGPGHEAKSVREAADDVRPATDHNLS